MVISNGKFLVDNSTIISGASSLVKEGEYLAEMLSNASGKNIEFQADNAKGSIVLVIDATISNEEGYVLDVKYDNIRITGKMVKVFFMGSRHFVNYCLQLWKKEQ